MTEGGSWPAIRRHGLLSTTALLDLYGLQGARRAIIESNRRPDVVPLEHPAIGRAIIRDQNPLDDTALRRCLEDGLSPQDWYRLLNRKVFFWLTRERLLKLLKAKPYRSKEHDVLELDARELVDAYRLSIALSPINSGTTKRYPAARGLATFLPIAAYPYANWRKKRAPGERVVELVVEYGVPDAVRFVQRVTTMRVEAVMDILYERNS